MPTPVEHGPGRSQEFGVPSRHPTWVGRPQAFESPAVDFPAGNWIESRATVAQIGALISDVSIEGGSSICCFQNTIVAQEAGVTVRKACI